MGSEMCIRDSPSTSPGHFVLKSCGLKVRLVTDYWILNEFILRPIRPFSSATDLMRRVQPEAKWFCKLDAIDGYFQVPLDEESQLLTAFLLPNGKWIYVVAPMGMNISSDEFNIRSDRAVAEYLNSWLLKIVDNMAIQGATLQEVFVRLRLFSSIRFSRSSFTWTASGYTRPVYQHRSSGLSRRSCSLIRSSR